MATPTIYDTLSRLGGVATRSELVTARSHAALRRGLADGTVVRVARGRYVGRDVCEDRRLAHALSGALSHLSAAVYHGWKVKHAPAEAWVTVPRKRHLRMSVAGVQLRWADLHGKDVAAGVTSPLRTVLDCARVLPFDEGLRSPIRRCAPEL